MAAQSTRLCIISREPLRSALFSAALQASLGPDDLLEIIVDRRYGGASGKADLTEDRRHQRQVALALEVNGFAIVPAAGDRTEERIWSPRRSLLTLDVPPIERASPLLEAPLEEPPIARLSAVDDDDRLSPVDDDDEESESIASSQRQRPGTLMPKLVGVLIGVALAALVLLLAGLLSGQSRLSQLLTDQLRGGPERSPDQPAVAETPAPARPDTESSSAGGSASSAGGSERTAGGPASSAGGPARTNSVSPRDADRLTPRPRATNRPSEVAGTASQEPNITRPNQISTATRGASAPADETAVPQQAETDKSARDARPELGPGAPARQDPSAPPRSSQVAGVSAPDAATSKAPSKQVADPQRAELVGAPVSRGWGDSYAVRVLDSAGQPLGAASVMLVARMADGTVENVAMGALTEPGTFRGTVPTNRSTPVDLRVRVTTDGGSVEIPVRP